MSSQKLKWNHPLLQKKQMGSIDSKEMSQQKHEKFGSKNKLSINHQSSCKPLQNLKNSLIYSNKCSPISSIQHSVACDIKKVKKGIENTIIARRSVGLNNHLGQVQKILHEAKVVLQSAHLLFNEIKDMMANLKQNFTFSIEKYLKNNYSSFIKDSHIKKTQSINLKQKSDEIQTLTNLTTQINNHQQKNQFLSMREKLTQNQHINSTSIFSMSTQKSNTCFNKYNTTFNRRNNILQSKTKTNNLSPKQSKEKSIQKLKNAINRIKTCYDTSNLINSDQII